MLNFVKKINRDKRRWKKKLKIVQHLKIKVFQSKISIKKHKTQFNVMIQSKRFNKYLKNLLIVVLRI